MMSALDGTTSTCCHAKMHRHRHSRFSQFRHLTCYRLKDPNTCWDSIYPVHINQYEGRMSVTLVLGCAVPVVLPGSGVVTVVFVT